ncbi:unnamed protein product [Paramecium octaurelia]|uniref:Uncharacterized protein n=1 Tax=Paramecium octaurelia TaxID=43137 RepID=A0A8S1XFQ0_PAROT|nr:unnamed protein product [Paramecium octaurelia]
MLQGIVFKSEDSMILGQDQRLKNFIGDININWFKYLVLIKHSYVQVEKRKGLV